MFIEKRKIEKNVKFYLVHSYRENGIVHKIRKYLGLNLPHDELANERRRAEKEILKQIEKLKTEVFQFKLSREQISILNKFNEKIGIFHLNKKEWKNFTKEFVYNTNAIEGSTVLREEVENILKKEKVFVPDEIETKGVAEAVEYIREAKEELSLQLLLNLHKMCFSGTKHFAGRLRNVEVVVTNSRGQIVHQGMPAKELNNALEEMVKWYKKNKGKFKPLVLAAILHNQFEYVHPFQDGNGRVGRLLLNFILLKNKYPPINILLEDRSEYYAALSEYDKSQNIKPMLQFLIKQYNKTLKQVTTR
jgi:Fic family protein